MEAFQIISTCISILILIATVYYIAHAPVNAVRIGRELNTEEQKDNAKRSLFLTLFSLRANPVHYDYVTGLNQIDVVFEDTPSVLTAWHIHYDSLNIDNQVDENKIWELQRTNLLSAMAQSLGYNQIRQTDMQQHYTPIGHGNLRKMEWEFRDAQMTYYKVNAAMAERIMERMDIQDESTETPKPDIVIP
jgi:hypothetical protein